MAERHELETGSQVRNIKTRNVGVVLDFADQETAIVEYEMRDPVKGAYKSSAGSRIQDLELLNKGEFQLVKKLFDLRAEKEKYTKLLDEARSNAAKAEDELLEYMLSHDIESTKVYEGYGVGRIDGHRVCPSIKKEDESLAFSEIREMGRGEIIKEGINAKTLESFISELLKTGKTIPAHVNYFLKPKIALRKN